MNIAMCIERLFPDLAREDGWRVVDESDGKGPRLVWEAALPEPTQGELEAAWSEIVRERRKRELEVEAMREVESAWSAVGGELSPEMAEKKAVLARVQGTALTAAERAASASGRAVFGKLETKLEEVEVAENPEAVMWDG